MKFGLIDWIGLVGGLCFLSAFWRTSIGKWTGRSLWYELDNLAGGVLMTIYAYEKTAYISVGLNIIWAVVAFRGVTSWAERHAKSRASKRDNI